MQHEIYAALAGEPWRMRPWEIARLTDYQIFHVYLLPEMRRAKEFAAAQGQTGAHPMQPTAAPSAEPPPSREELIAVLVKWGARTPEQAEAEADARLANWAPDGGE